MSGNQSDVRGGVPWLFFLFLAASLAGLVVVSSGMGYLAISPSQVVDIIVAGFSGQDVAGLPETFGYVVWDVRLPRILTAAFVGGGLAVAGVLFQAILLNPLADPYTLGVSSGAAFGACLGLLVNLSFLGSCSVPLLAFSGAVTTLFVVLWLASVDGRLGTNTLILSGVIVAAILSAGIGFIKHLADEQVGVIIFWLMGSFASKTWLDVAMTAAAGCFGLAVALFYGRDLNIMALGHRTSESLGVDTSRTRKILLVCGTLVTATCVAVSGIIGFIGLITPHLMRFILGPDNRSLAPASFLAGAILLLIADTITRAVLPSEVPIGVLTALIGGPFFCYIFRSKQQVQG
ncbi:MAG: iron ABC transporter permease [Thermodesulfobacteriota bacterium]|nr:iron ABC transporter permease [Thermodesulfobacteriota bacterium]